MSSIFDHESYLIYILTDRNQIFRYQRTIQTNLMIEFNENRLYGFHAYSIVSMGLCAHKSWLITLGSDNWLRIVDYKDDNREILSKYIPDGAFAVTSKSIWRTFVYYRTETCFSFKDSDPYGFHLCLALLNRIHLYLITNSEFRLIYQYETRNTRFIELSSSGHLLAIITTNLIQIYSTIHMNLISQLRGHVGKIQQIAWCKNDSILISCGTDGMIYTFNVYTGMTRSKLTSVFV